mmetsp:Transcript_29081/g.28062  ORF Transcript_29081/g.28062 Transcript_29081/m.28062 type:complete len:172 (-) Transcript_29081:579-1094(-)
MGFCFAFGIIIIILLPILIFSDPILMHNPIYAGSFSLQLEFNSNGKLYDILESQAVDIKRMNSTQVADVENYFTPVDVQFSSEYMQTLQFSPYSDEVWQISPPNLYSLIDDFNIDTSSDLIEIPMTVDFTRENSIGYEVATYYQVSYVSKAEFQPVIDYITAELNSSSNGT